MPVSPKTKADSLSKEEKVAYVKSQGQIRDHHCHWVGCSKQVPPAMWGCYKHWMRLPKPLRDAVWYHFSPGQEVNMTPSREYIAIAREVKEWIISNCRCITCSGTGRSSKGSECIPCNGSGVQQ